MIFGMKSSALQRWRPNGAWVGVSFALIVVAPFCDWAFACGCDWPWRGLAGLCNYFDAASQDKCPWCVHTVIGAVAVAGAVMVGGTAGACRFISPAWTWRTLFAVASVLLFLLLWAGITHWRFVSVERAAATEKKELEIVNAHRSVARTIAGPLERSRH